MDMLFLPGDDGDVDDGVLAVAPSNEVMLRSSPISVELQSQMFIEKTKDM